MCGILAQLNFRGAINLTNFERQLEAQAHRGPDGSHYWLTPDGRVALAHNLLSLTGNQNVRQPFFNETRSIVVSVNGEFYHHEKLRAMLMAKGHLFHSDSDSELLVHLYEEYREGCLDYLEGEFAFVLWDDTRKEIFAARDRFGIKPIHYQLNDDAFLIASEAKSILQTKQSAKWNLQALQRTFTHQYLAPDESLFAGISQIPPAHYLTFKNGNLTLKNYWSPKSTTHKELSPDELQNQLEEAIRVRLHPEAAYSLSAGIDSSYVVAVASRILGHPVPAFSVSFDDGPYDELPLIRETAATIGASVTPVSVTSHDLLAHLAEAVQLSEGLAINGQLVGKHLLARAIQQAGHRVVISGEGADEALLGYAHLLNDYAPETVPAHPLQRGIMLPQQGSSITSTRPNWLNGWPTFLQAKSSFCNQTHSLLDTDFRETMLSKDPLTNTLARIENLGYALPDDDLPHQGAWLWTRLALANAILKTLADGTEMPHGLEGRLPFLDHKFFQSAWNLPTTSKLAHGKTKTIFRDIARTTLPPAICNREKHPFLAPPLLSSPSLVIQVRERLTDSSFDGLEFFNRSAILPWFDQVASGSTDDKQAADPTLHLILSSMALQNAYQLSL